MAEHEAFSENSNGLSHTLFASPERANAELVAFGISHRHTARDFRSAELRTTKLNDASDRYIHIIHMEVDVDAAIARIIEHLLPQSYIMM